MYPDTYALAFMIFLAAALYSSVGHGGASGYLAAMALMGVAPDTMKPAALSLNILVSGIATWRFARAGVFSWRVFWPFAITSIPCAFLGGLLTAPEYLYQTLLGVVLLYSAGYALWRASAPTILPAATPAVWVALPTGAGLGLLSGLTGVGGGIFLSPLLLLNRWASPKTISAVAAPFILVNSLSGLTGLLSQGESLPSALPLWLAAAGVGGSIGAELGSRRLDASGILRVLAVVLVVAGLKMLVSAWT